MALHEDDVLSDILPEGFSFTDEKLSLLETDKSSSAVLRSEGYYIFALHNVGPGEHTYAFQNWKAGQTVSFLLWASLSANGDNEHPSCGGDLVWIDSGHPHFASCDVSGHDSVLCKQIFSKEASRVQFNDLTSELVYTLYLKEKYKISELHFNSGETSLNNIKKFEVMFDNDSKQTIEMGHRTGLIKNEIIPVMATLLTIKVFETHNLSEPIIGNWQVFGYLCKSLPVLE